MQQSVKPVKISTNMTHMRIIFDLVALYVNNMDFDRRAPPSFLNEIDEDSVNLPSEYVVNC